VYVSHIEHFIESSCFCTVYRSSVSRGFVKQIAPVLRILLYNSSLVTWTVASLTTARFKPLISSLSGFALSHTVPSYNSSARTPWKTPSSVVNNACLLVRYPAMAALLLLSVYASGMRHNIFITWNVSVAILPISLQNWKHTGCSVVSHIHKSASDQDTESKRLGANTRSSGMSCEHARTYSDTSGSTHVTTHCDLWEKWIQSRHVLNTQQTKVSLLSVIKCGRLMQSWNMF
jgi:hypothetical protein